MSEPTRARRGLDKLLASYPDAAIQKLDWQLEQPDMQFAGTIELGQTPGPWICVDLTNGGKFAIWKETGNCYRVGADGAVEDDPFIVVTPPGSG